jgi:hypothetical protein
MAYHISEVITALAGTEKGNDLKELRHDPETKLVIVRFTKLFYFDKETAEHTTWLDPANNWQPTKHKHVSPGYVSEDAFEYGTTVNGLKLPNTHTHSWTEKGETGTHVKKLQNFKVLTDKDPADFRLPAFGFPEPMGMPTVRRQTKWYTWLGWSAVGIMSIVVVAAVYRKLTRKAIAP